MSIGLPDIKQSFERGKELFETTLEATVDDVELDGCVLKDALKAQTKLQMRWELVTKRLNRVYDDIETYTETIYANAIKTEMRNKNKMLSITEAKEYAKTDPVYYDCRIFMAEVRELRDEARGLLDVVIARRYILNNLTNSVVASVDRTIL